MTVSNLGVCFGPTLLRPEEETVASIMDLKFYNIVVEILIENYEKLFFSKPETAARIPTSSNVNNGPPKYRHLPPNNHLPTDSNDIYGTNLSYFNTQPTTTTVPSWSDYNAPTYTCVSAFCVI